MSNFIELVLLAVSLCADCFAVSLCSSVTMKSVKVRTVIWTALAFAVIHTGLLLSGYFFGNAFVGLVEKIAHIIGFAMLLYVGLSMVWDGIKAKGECRNLNGLRNVLIGSMATSIDAAAVGLAQSMNFTPRSGALLLAALLFVITFVSVFCGINIGKTIACRSKKVGRIAEIVGGVILIGIGVGILL